MWVYTKPRNEHDKRMLVDLSHYPVITISQLGDRWFVDAGTGSDTSSLASTASHEEADAIVKYIFDSLKAGEKAIDLNASQETKRQQKTGTGG